MRPIVIANVTLVTRFFPIWEWNWQASDKPYFVLAPASKLKDDLANERMRPRGAERNLGPKEETLASPFDPISQILW